jgi:two-component system response regulator FixJ
MGSDVRIHVVDDDAAMRDSLAFLLESAGFQAELYDGAQPLLAALPDLAGCVLTDIRMPGMDGLELLRLIRASGRNVPVVIMTGHGDVPLAVEAMKLGAADFIEKPFDDEALLRALRDASRRAEPKQTVDPEAEAIRQRVARLSQRERQVFGLVVAGQTNKVIARELALSPRTVEIYRANVMTKMQAAGLSELVRAAVRAGLA